ncbi:PI-PLC X domain-containing protein 1-like [Centroberyx affinis]|uniref:PI-PLC X domain-containing protein 1-like n=1 Tax=Centroberyx affinis TaxID=166261 RepID=UPI003A5C1E12
MAVVVDQGQKGERSGSSNWMSGLPDKLQNIPLWNLAIPGSHDTMTYDLDVNSHIMEPDQLKRWDNLPCVHKIIYKWAVTQEATITEQLDAGVRYFDLRIARKPNDSDPTRLFFYHGLYTQTDVESVLSVINDWAERHPKEILILALSHFKEMQELLHNHLINFIKTLFGAKLFHTGETPTLKCCWESGRNVIISYDYKANQHPELWMNLTYYYGRSMDSAEIESQLDDKLKLGRPLNCFFICGLNLTLPENVEVVKYILRPCNTLAKATLRSLPTLLEWVKKQTPGAGETCVNIIASDLVNRDDFVSTVIKLND